MQSTLLKCALVGGIIAFLWGVFSWMILPWHSYTFDKFKNEAKVAEVIRDNTSSSGLYILPNMHKAMTDKEKKVQGQLMANGPVMLASVSMQGMNNFGLHAFISLIIQIIGAYLIAWLLIRAKLAKYMERLGFVTIAGLLVGVLGHLPSWNWWGFPVGYTLIMILDLVIAWFLAGLAIAKLAKR